MVADAQFLAVRADDDDIITVFELGNGGQGQGRQPCRRDALQTSHLELQVLGRPQDADAVDRAFFQGIGAF